MPLEHFKEHLELNAMIGCKSMCKYCPQETFVKRYFEVGDTSFKPLQLTLDNCKRYLESVPKDMIISLAGFSEPFASDEIVDIYRWLKSEGRPVDINTTLYNVDKKVLKDIIDIGVGFFQLHVPDKNNYTNIQIDKEYTNKLRYVLRHLNKENSHLVITCLGEIHPEIERIIDKYRDNISAENIGHIYINDRAGLVTNGTAYKSQYIHGKVYCCKTVKSLNYTVLLPDGNLVLCCMDFGLNNILGNLRFNTYEEIMNGEKANEIRRLMDIEGVDLICRHCEFAVDVEKYGEPEEFYKNFDDCGCD